MSEDVLAVWASGSMAKSAVWIIMLLHLFLYVLGQLPAPQNVNLTSENFRSIVTWEAGAWSPPGTRYTVEARSLSKGPFSPVKTCINITTVSCDLSQNFTIPSFLYWVRVKSVTSTSESKWVESKELQPNRDTILGPPIVTVSSRKQTIEVTLDMPLTPHKREDNDSPKTLNDIDSSLIYIITLLDKDDKQYAKDKVKPDKLGNGFCQFENLKPKFTYCVVAKFESLRNHHIKDSKKICTTTSPQNTDMLWIAPLIAVLVFIVSIIIVSIVAWTLKEFTCLHRAQSQLPKSLVIIYEDLHVNLQSQELDENPEGDHISFITHDDRSNDYQQKCQSTELATKVQLTPPNCIIDTDESICYQSNGLSSDGYERNSLMKETDVCTYRDVGGLPSYIQASTENKDSTSSTQQITPGVPVSYNLQQYQQFSSLKDTEQTRSSNIAESAPTQKTVQHDFGTSCQFQEMKIETAKIELWNCSDVPLSSVKLSFNDDTGKDNSEVGTSGEETSDLLSTDDLCSQITYDLTVATDLPPNGMQEYQAQPIKWPQFINDYKFRNLGQKPSFHISKPEGMQFSDYESH